MSKLAAYPNTTRKRNGSRNSIASVRLSRRSSLNSLTAMARTAIASSSQYPLRVMFNAC